MNQEDFTVREEPLQTLAQFAGTLAEVSRACERQQAGTAAAIRASLLAECTKCGIHVSGDELLAIAESPDTPAPSDKVKRMRLGYCARDGCESFTYRLSFRNHPGLDWRAVFAQMETVRQNRGELTAAEAAAGRVAARKRLWRSLKRVAIALAIIGLLLGMRQWYVGGRIPLIREPEKFRVDPLPPGQQEPHR